MREIQKNSGDHIVCYDGNKPYVFISYAHKDIDAVKPVLKRIEKDGIRFWYDTGIASGTEWRDFIGSKLADCKVFIAFISANYLDSKYCKKELYMADRKDKFMLLIYLEEDLKLDEGMELIVGGLQYINKKTLSDEEFYRKLYSVPELDDCTDMKAEPKQQQEPCTCKCAVKIYENLGGRENYIKALEVYQKCLEMLEELHKKSETNEYLNDLSLAYKKAADVSRRIGEKEYSDMSLNYYEKYLSTYEEIVLMTDSLEDKKVLSAGYNRTAKMYEQRGGRDNLMKALALSQKDIFLSQGLCMLENTPENRRNLLISYHTTANISEQLGGEKNRLNTLDLYRKGLALAEQLSASENTSESKRDLSVSYNKVAGIYEQLGGKDNLQKALELYQKTLTMHEQLSASENTIDAYDDLALSLYKVAMHPYTDTQNKKKLLERGVQVAKMLYDNLPNERYKAFVEGFEEELKNMGE